MKIEPEFPKAQNRYGWDYFEENPPKFMRTITLSGDLGMLTACAARAAWKPDPDHVTYPPEILSVAIVVEVASTMTEEFEQALREKALEILKINPRPPYKPAVEAKEESGGIC